MRKSAEKRESLCVENSRFPQVFPQVCGRVYARDFPSFDTLLEPTVRAAETHFLVKA
jgi:hypothetical protein